MSTGADVEEWPPWSRSALCSFRRRTLGVFHGVGARRLRARLDELRYRRSRREKREDLFRRLLERCLLHGAALPSAGAQPRARGSEGSRSAPSPSLKSAALRGGLRVQGAQIA